MTPSAELRHDRAIYRGPAPTGSLDRE